MEDPDAYVNSKLQRKDAHELSTRIIAQMTWTGSDIVLDFGTGSGFVTKNVLLPLILNIVNNNTGEGPIMYSLDISKKMHHFATTNYPSENIVYLLGDLTKNDFKMPCKVDKVISSFAFHWITDQVNVLKSIYKVLKVNGEIGIFFTAASTTFDIYPYLAGMTKWAPYMTDFDKFVPATHPNPELAKQNLCETLEQIGFFVQECDTIDRNYDSNDAMIDAFMSTNPFISRIPSEFLEEFRMDAQEAFRSCVTQLESREYSIMVIRARKENVIN